PIKAANGNDDGAVRAGAREDAGSEGFDPFEQALAAFRNKRYAEAQRRFERLSHTSTPRAPEAALYAAQATRNASGCATALSRFDHVRLRYPGSPWANEALWRSARCLERL